MPAVMLAEMTDSIWRDRTASWRSSNQSFCEQKWLDVFLQGPFVFVNHGGERFDAERLTDVDGEMPKQLHVLASQTDCVNADGLKRFEADAEVFALPVAMSRMCSQRLMSLRGTPRPRAAI